MVLFCFTAVVPKICIKKESIMRNRKKMNHILFYLSGLEQGGTERVVVNLAEFFWNKGYKVTLATTHQSNNEYSISQGIKRILTSPSHDFITNSRISNFKIRLTTLRSILREEQPDVVAAFIGKNNMMAILSSVGLHIPVYVAVRGEPMAEYYSRGMRLMAKILFVFAKGVILQTEQSKDFFPIWIQKKCHILSNPLKTDFLKENLREQVENTIVTVGRCDENKNQKLLIDAFAEIEDRYPNTKVYLYGDGELRSQLIEYVEKLGLSNQILLHGKVEDTRETIKNAGIFVLTSNTEGMPNALIEAMVLGLPVISTNCPCGGPKMLIEEGKNGLLIPVGDKKALADAIIQLLDNPDIRQSLGNQALKLKETLYPEKVNMEWEDYLTGQ